MNLSNFLTIMLFSKSDFSALKMAWELGYTIAIPLVVFALAGQLLDKKFNTSPFLLLIGILISLVVTSIAVYRKATKIMAETEKNHENKRTKEH